jgi:hypothetical protein
MNRKYIALQNKFLPINSHVVLGAGFRNAGAKKSIVNELTQSMGGMLIGDRNVIKGNGVRGPERRRPIKFII